MSVVYYDIQFERLIEFVDGTPRSGTLSLHQRPLVSRDMVYLPVPEAFEPIMVPTDATLRFTIQHQIMGIRDLDI